MLQKITAIRILLGIHLIMMIWQFLVLAKIIPYHIFLVGKINVNKELVPFMTISILISATLIAGLIVKLANIKHQFLNEIVNGTLWVFVVLFALNSIKNISSGDWLVMSLGTALTIISSFLCWKIVKE